MRCPVLTAACAAGLLLSSHALVGQATSTAAHQAHRVQSALGLKQARVLPVAVHGEPGGPLLVAVDLGLPGLLELRPRSVRAPGFRLLEQREDGSWVRADPGPVRTYAGRVAGAPDSAVVAALLEDGLYARIDAGPEQRYWIEPVAGRVAGVGAGAHVVYRADDVLPTPSGCGLELLANARPVLPVAGGNPGTAQALSAAELACDADFEYFSRHGSTTAVSNRIQSVIATVNTQYENEVDITHQITTILVRTSPSQPYTSTDAVTLLHQFRNQWNQNHGSVQRDLAQLFTGKNLNGSTIGVAWVGVVCNLSYAYSLVESDFNSNFACVTDLSAHELGHNWNADHCSCSGYTMNPSITCANRFHPTFSIPEITQFRSSRTCLGSGGGGTPTAVHVASITVSTPKAGKGRRGGRAVVVIEDDLGNPVASAVVSGQFTGGITESVSGTTGGNGSVTLNTSGSVKGKLSITFCVTGVAASLPYMPGQNVETCDSK